MELENSKKQRSPRRLRHEAEIAVFRSQAGDLEDIRISLGLRPSQICEILKVHPSAWTRWVKEGKAPPHIYQMLEWYMELLGWRGQNSPLKSSETTNSRSLLQKLRFQSVETYVPKEIEQPGGQPQKYIEKKVFVTILSFSLATQFILLLGLLLWLKK